MTKQRLAILGATGSIGTQTLDVVAANPELFDVYAITGNNNVDALIEQARRFRPEVVVVANENHYQKLKDALADLPIKTFAGSDAIAEVVALPSVDTVVTAMVGYAGLKPTIAAIEARQKNRSGQQGNARCSGRTHHTPHARTPRRHSACRFGAWRNFPMPCGRKSRRSGENHTHGIGRSVPYKNLRRPCPSYSKRGSSPPNLADGRENHYRLGEHDEQRVRSD